MFVCNIMKQIQKYLYDIVRIRSNNFLQIIEQTNFYFAIFDHAFMKFELAVFSQCNTAIF